MLEEDRLRLKEIALRVAEIQQWTGGLDEQTFLADPKSMAAVTMNIMVIGETARRLTHTVRDLEPTIPWSSIVNLRNRIAHSYESVDQGIVWRIVQEHIAALDAAVSRMLAAP